MLAPKPAEIGDGRDPGRADAVPGAGIHRNPSLWRLVEVAAWLEQHTDLRLLRPPTEVARIASRLNLDLQTARLRDVIAAA